MEESTFSKKVWRLNALIILVAGILAIFLLLIGGYYTAQKISGRFEEDRGYMKQSVLTLSGINLVLFTVATCLGKMWLKHMLNTARETLRSELTSNTNKELERLKNDLVIHSMQSAKEHSTIFDKQVEVMDSIYKSLTKIFDQASKTLWYAKCPNTPELIREEASKLNEEIKNLTKYFNQHKIYIDVDTCASIADAISKASKPAIEYICYLKNYDDNELHTIQDVRNRNWDKVCEGLHPAIQTVENKFRDQFLYHKR